MENLGKLGRDKVTGFKGIIIGKTIYLFGCSCYGIAPKVKGDKLGETLWFDEGRIEIIGRGIKPADVRSNKNGGENLTNPNNRVQ